MSVYRRAAARGLAGPVRSAAEVARAALVLALAVAAGSLGSCAAPVAMRASRAEPPALTVSVRRSVLLGEYANPPLWTWTVDAGATVAVAVDAVAVSLDGGAYQRLHPAARSFRPPRTLAPGEHRLTVRVTMSGASAGMVEKSAAAQVRALPGRPPVPDDPCYPAAGARTACGGAGTAAGQWPLRHIRLPELWQALATGVLSRQPAPVVVAVLDTGYARHPDLQGNLDPAAGYDFVSARSASGDGDGIDPDATDPGPGGSWHGTAIAAVIAARTGNGSGVAGMGWPWGRSHITIMPVRVAGRSGATTYDVVQGLRYAAGLDNDSGLLPPVPARVINLSLAEAVPGPTDEVLEEALRAVTAAGVVVVAAAGNHGSAVRAPATSPNTLAVGSVTVDGTLAEESNFGREIDVVAPGGAESVSIPVLAVGPGTGPARWNVRPDHGTSIAAAHVSGVLALLAGVDRSLTLSEARALLADAAVDLGPPGRDDRYGPGLLDAFALFGAYGADAEARGRTGHEPAAGGGTGRSVPGSADAAHTGRSADPHALIVRYRDRRMKDAARAAAAGELLRVRHSVAGVAAGRTGYALVRLRAGQARAHVKARLAADPAVAAVYDNRIYLPAAIRARD